MNARRLDGLRKKVIPGGKGAGAGMMSEGFMLALYYERILATDISKVIAGIPESS